eukprot:1188032-Prorocentrum_minimum.AAC.5
MRPLYVCGHHVSVSSPRLFARPRLGLPSASRPPPDPLQTPSRRAPDPLQIPSSEPQQSDLLAQIDYQIGSIFTSPVSDAVYHDKKTPIRQYTFPPDLELHGFCLDCSIVREACTAAVWYYWRPDRRPVHTPAVCSNHATVEQFTLCHASWIVPCSQAVRCEPWIYVMTALVKSAPGVSLCIFDRPAGIRGYGEVDSRVLCRFFGD